MSTSYARIKAQTETSDVFKTETTSTKTGRYNNYGTRAEASQEESTMDVATDFPLNIGPSNSSSVASGEEEEQEHPPRSGRRNTEEENYLGLEAEYGSWKSGGQSLWSLRCHCLLWTVAILLLLYCCPNS